ncbi:hypothetical protein [Aquabacter spiritensis]|uniref:Carrier domain-containing protein n=1 Tax=Aquabacter spiritensis TaxID=933073 RepID=A0A4R3LY61_9HYPH|nr:hypothetical protein [Aquabacter spiritensis]TCT05592.1 hypothetical protein EDC64_104149 [Aquabacter spiritensis]
MVEVAEGHAALLDRKALQEEIIAFLQREIQDPSVILTMETPTDSVVIDSLDIARVLFKIEEKYQCEIVLSLAAPPEYVGEIVDFLIDQILLEKQNG